MNANRTIQVRVTERQKLIIENRMEMMGFVRMSDFIRFLALDNNYCRERIRKYVKEFSHI
ncbi:MAG: hypothetical protein K9N07_10380 [Candidatus Cloacimonetes bacterium]|nr:hypothetical protein [Candidatus Cloacimonadota bacterium]MCF8012746.1 hypothetical protein [Candidatus Woesearchaeota archaeon]